MLDMRFITRHTYTYIVTYVMFTFCFIMIMLAKYCDKS